MSTKLPVVRDVDLVRALRHAGWIEIRTRGSHVRLARGESHVSVPLHDPVKRGTLAQILDDVGMSSDELRKLL